MSAAAWAAVSRLAFLHGRRISARDLAGTNARAAGSGIEVAACALEDHGFRVRLRKEPLAVIAADVLPAVVTLRSGEAVVLERIDGGRAFVWHPSREGERGGFEETTLDALQELAEGAVLTAQPALVEAVAEDRAETVARRPRHWFWSAFAALRGHYGDCAVAAVLINVLALAGSMFSMNVYDRVIPNAAIHTLWVLALGVGLAALVELFLRTLRAHLVDDAGKRADLALSVAIFRHVLGLRPKDRPSASAHFASHVRDFESVREFVSSTTLVALTDLPFVVLFLFVIGLFGGELVWLPVGACVAVLITGAVAQWPMRRAIEQYQHESAQKFAYTVETFERLETIQALGSAPDALARWERLCAVSTRSAARSRLVSTIALNVTQFIQQFASTALIVWGVYLVLAGRMTTGALIGCSILASRALAPMGQIAGLMTRWQQARASFVALNRVMSTPGTYDPQRTYLRMDRARGALTARDIEFSYPRSQQKVLSIGSLDIAAGEAVALMGPVGSGKSTLLRLLAGLQDCETGQLLLDGIDASQISPADFRAQIAWVGQDAVLFRGTLRENLLAGAPDVAEEEFVRILELTGIVQLANAHPHGLDMAVGEGGNALSGGQRQMVALARALLARSPVLLLDEPTSAFDGAREQSLVQALVPVLQGRTVVIATHRPAPLELVSRIIVLDRGHVVADGPRDEVLRAVAAGSIRRGPRLREVTPEPAVTGAPA